MKKQFNLDEWLHDKSRKLMTRTGEPVEIINHEVMGKYCIYAKATWQDGEIFNICTTSNGEAYEGEETAYDIFFADEEELTREQEIEQQSFVYYETCSDEDIAKSKGFIEGAKWADQNPRKGLWDAEKVIDYIYHHAHVRTFGDIVLDDMSMTEFVETIKKAMEE